MVRYKRTLGEVTQKDGRNLGQEIVRAGLAWWYRTYAPKERALADLEQDARASRRGLWSEAGRFHRVEWVQVATAGR